MNRYARQMMLPEIGDKGQARLASAHVAVIGAGGLGCPVLQYLAGAGVGKITLLDPDIIEQSNLHRQPLYRMPDLGRPKAEVAREFVQTFNPGVEIDAQIRPLGPSRAKWIAETVDIVIDAADSFAVTYMLSDACLAEQTPLISASVLGQTGYVGGFCAGAPSMRAVFPDPPLSTATCATAGVLGPAVGVLGSLQAQMTLRVLLDLRPPVMGKMVTADLADLRFGDFSFLGTPEPEHLFPFAATNMLRDSDLIVELRDTDEAPHPLVPQAVRMTPAGLKTLSAAPGQRVVLCCHSGLRAWRAASELHARNFKDLNLLAATACA